MIVGAKRIGDTGTVLPLIGEVGFPAYHAYILVVDPNRNWYRGVSDEPRQYPTPKFGTDGADISGNPEVDANATVYYFRGGPDQGKGWDKLVTDYGYYITFGASLGGHFCLKIAIFC